MYWCVLQAYMYIGGDTRNTLDVMSDTLISKYGDKYFLGRCFTALSHALISKKRAGTEGQFYYGWCIWQFSRRHGRVY